MFYTNESGGWGYIAPPPRDDGWMFTMICCPVIHQLYGCAPSFSMSIITFSSTYTPGVPRTGPGMWIRTLGLKWPPTYLVLISNYLKIAINNIVNTQRDNFFLSVWVILSNHLF